MLPLVSPGFSSKSPLDNRSVSWFPFRSVLRISGWFSVNKLEIGYMEWYRRLYSGRQISQFMPSLLYSQYILKCDFSGCHNFYLWWLSVECSLLFLIELYCMK